MTRKIITALVLATSAAFAAGAVVWGAAAVGWQPAPTDNEQWQRGYRMGYETGRHDANIDHGYQRTLLPVSHRD